MLVTISYRLYHLHNKADIEATTAYLIKRVSEINIFSTHPRVLLTTLIDGVNGFPGFACEIGTKNAKISCYLFK